MAIELGNQWQPLGSSHKKPGHQTRVHIPLQEIVVLWSMAEGQHEGSAHTRAALQRITVDPHVRVFQQKPAL